MNTLKNKSCSCLENKDFKRSLLANPFFICAGILAGGFCGVGFSCDLFIPGIFIALSALILYFFHRAVAVFLLSVAIGLSYPQIRKNLPYNHIKNIIKRHQIVSGDAVGIICSPIEKKDKFSTFEFAPEKFKNIEVEGKILVRSKFSEASPGDKIKLVLEIKKFEKTSNPHSFRYEEFLAAKGIYAQGEAVSPEIILNSPKISLIKIYAIIADKTDLLLRKRFGRHYPFVKAVLLGDKSNLGDLKDSLTSAGLSHIIAVSGLHTAVISMILLAVFTSIFRNKNFARVILMIFLGFYVWLCGFSPSVMRASIMISVFMITQMLHRRQNHNQVLIYGAVIIFFYNPFQIINIGFLLSFTATATLINVKFPFKKNRFEKYFLALIFFRILNIIYFSAILTLALAPFTMYFFHQISFNGIIANILAIPLIGLILPAAVTVILSPEFLLQYFTLSFDLLMKILLNWVDLVNLLPGYFTNMPFSATQFYLSISSVLLIIVMQNFPKKRKFGYLFFSLLLLAVFIFKPVFSDKLELIFFDCGLGDLIYIKTPDNHHIMIDAGPPGRKVSGFARSALPWFRHHGIKKLDWVFITHAHNDHYGGIKDLLKYADADKIAVTDEFTTRKVWKIIKPEIKRDKAEIVKITDTLSVNYGDVRLKILHPDKEYYHENINNMSIVVKLDYKDFSAVFTGDLEKDGEEYLIKKYPEFLQADILKAGHHGSKTSSSENFVRLADPEYVVVCASEKNKFGFPHKRTLDTYEHINADLMITGKDGAVIFSTDGKSLTLETWKTKRFIEDFDI